MKYDNGKEIENWTSMDNDVLERIYRIEDLSKLNKDILLSICRQTFHQNGDNIIRTSWWAAADITTKQVGCSERSVRRAYDEFAKRKMISIKLRLREKDINGKLSPRYVNWITINTNTDAWDVQERGDDNNLSHDRTGSCRDKNPG